MVENLDVAGIDWLVSQEMEQIKGTEMSRFWDCEICIHRDIGVWTSSELEVGKSMSGEVLSFWKSHYYEAEESGDLVRRAVIGTISQLTKTGPPRIGSI